MSDYILLRVKLTNNANIGWTKSKGNECKISKFVLQNM